MLTTPFVFIADDSSEYRLLLQHLFVRFLPDFAARFFVNGEDLVRQVLLLAPKPNLIILDLHMPVLDGHQTLIRLRQEVALQLTPVVMISAQATMAEILQCYLAGANSFIIKPLTFDQLREAMLVTLHYWSRINYGPSEE